MAERSNTYEKTIAYLQRIYSLINQEYFNNELQEITILSKESVSTYGSVTTHDIWITETESTKELNISANYLKRDISEIVTTLIHECCHIWNMQHNIKDTSREGTYHNKAFKKTAEELGKIQVEQDSKHGWTISKPSEETIDFCKRHNLENIQIWRLSEFFDYGSEDGTPPTTKTKKPSSTRKYKCPCCKNSFRATKMLNVLCMDCNAQFILDK